MNNAKLNLYTDQVLQEEQYLELLNGYAQPEGYKIDTVFGIFIQDYANRQYARIDYRGRGFVINTTSSTYSLSEAGLYIQELESAIRTASKLNEVLEVIKEEIYVRFANENGIDIDQ